MSMRVLYLSMLMGMSSAVVVMDDAAAQGFGGNDDAFFASAVATETETPKTTIDGSLVLSSFYFQESGDSINRDTTEVADNASPVNRMYADARIQLGIKNIAASRVHARVDVRGRVHPGCDLEGVATMFYAQDQCRTQSGTFGDDNEYEVRELYTHYGGSALEVVAGRQFIAEVAALKIDGLKAQYKLGESWSVLGFGGLYPSRISRSLLDDYRIKTYTVTPMLDEDGGLVSTEITENEETITPIAAGIGGSYRYDRYYGSVAFSSILPNNSYDDPLTNTEVTEDTRTFISSSGYWRPVAMADVYHLAIIDLTGAAGAGITNASLGVNVKPVRDVRINASYNRIDTDTLDAYARNRLVDPTGTNVVQNEVDIQRIASDSARLGLSMGFLKRRFEVSTSFQVRQREEVDFCPPGAAAADCRATLSAARSGEVAASLLDRRSLAGFRLGLNFVAAIPLGDSNVYRDSEWWLGRASIARSLLSDRLEWEADVSYLNSEDSPPSELNEPGGDVSNLPITGNTKVTTLAGATTIYWRLHRSVFALISVNGGLQTFEPGAIGGIDGSDDSQDNTFFSGFLRLAYRL